jgi:thiamine biosynthesis lipoprotein
MRELEFYAMGSHITAMVDAPFVDTGQRLKQLPAWFEDWEQALSRFRPESELNQLNRCPGEAVPVSQVLWDVFQVALAAEQESGGLVTPSLLDALEAAGYNRSFEGMEDGMEAILSLPTDPSPRLLASLSAVIADAPARTLTLPAGLRLDFGGSAKGWAAHQAMQRLAGSGPALVNAGGDIAASGAPGDGSPWLVGVLNPFDPDSDLITLALRTGGVATSGRDYRRWKLDGVWKHHIIDPRRRLPVETDLVSVTLLAATVMQAEMAAKLVFILGSQAGMAWLKARPALAALLVLEDGSMLRTASLKQYLWREG